jgi:hypothetical protein
MSHHAISTSCRALLAGAPAVAAAALAAGTAANVIATGLAKAAEADPIFALIEEHREATREWLDAIDTDDEVEFLELANDILLEVHRPARACGTRRELRTRRDGYPGERADRAGRMERLQGLGMGGRR